MRCPAKATCSRWSSISNFLLLYSVWWRKTTWIRCRLSLSWSRRFWNTMGFRQMCPQLNCPVPVVRSGWLVHLATIPASQSRSPRRRSWALSVLCIQMVITLLRNVVVRSVRALMQHPVQRSRKRKMLNPLPLLHPHRASHAFTASSHGSVVTSALKSMCWR
jgi:hypothetical protein